MERQWILLVCRMPAEPARHRMALWRELRRAGAVPIAQGVWALPDLPAVAPLLAKARQHTDAAGADLTVLHAAGHDPDSAARLDRLYQDARAAEWVEFRADCDKFLAELDKEHRIGKFTLAELDEEEQSLDRLRRWYRELRARDLLGSPAAVEAEQHLKGCTERLDQYAERVYATLGMPADQAVPDRGNS
ncbi:Chromate resistance protein ChrB [Sphaerisporangium perillae]|uniref:Chromate resistance protein ChrB n=1 Tax=Sphaerisporangium perillae TaxID=2935860 RepID=UPI00200FC67B|nr:Chromate resistance protein ChrB [Sphaerisporangium perillae]